MKKIEKKEQGFTLIEIIIVIVIIGFLAATIGPNLFNRLSQAEKTTAVHQIDIFKLALDNYRLDMKSYPSTESGLQALVQEPQESENSKNWKGPYLSEKKVPVDPWGNKYEYRNPGIKNQGKYDLWSNGADGKESGTDGDDVTNW